MRMAGGKRWWNGVVPKLQFCVILPFALKAVVQFVH